ncbi:hypothetical protein AVEN_14332-1 [Araneus ventricosus]|uniref:Uncharacterized protein n=1 Tax=Araneus ventricosus TaxID=182803 RepID=A0A4Y2VFH7_ARAVE|nr:hypothetical protein AVEN_14332-1 [Araneus ventricosus]
MRTEKDLQTGYHLKIIPVISTTQLRITKVRPVIQVSIKLCRSDTPDVQGIKFRPYLSDDSELRFVRCDGRGSQIDTTSGVSADARDGNRRFSRSRRKKTKDRKPLPSFLLLCPRDGTKPPHVLPHLSELFSKRKSLSISRMLTCYIYVPFPSNVRDGPRNFEQLSDDEDDAWAGTLSPNFLTKGMAFDPDGFSVYQACLWNWVLGLEPSGPRVGFP